MKGHYKVCILSAGKGMRLGALTKTFNKALLPINQKAIISHIIEKFPKNIEFVIATGFQGEKVEEYLSHAHSDRKISIVNVENFDGPGSGPGLSLLACREYLQCPFVVYASDTMVLEESIPEPDKNWMGVSSEFEDPEDFCTVFVKNGMIDRIDDKKAVDNDLAFIGISGIKDFKIFWDSLETDRKLINNEHQISNGLLSLIDMKCYPENFNWLDTGTLENYTQTRKEYESNSLTETFNFDKINEFTYFVNEKVIKYFGNPSHVTLRKKIAEGLGDLCPKLDLVTSWFFSYHYAPGDVLYENITPRMTSDFLGWLGKNLWKRSKYVSNSEFLKACKSFYRDKTYSRLDLFYKKNKKHSDKILVNGMELPGIKELLESIPWESLFDGIQSNFHGDLHFDNAIGLQNSVGRIVDFKLLDWRQDFGGLVECGDIYYDLAKFYGGLTLPYNLIKKNKFSYFESRSSGIRYDFQTSNSLNEAKEIFECFIEKSKYSLKKVKIIRGLIFLNMSPLHEEPFDKMLYHMARYYLNQVLNESK